MKRMLLFALGALLFLPDTTAFPQTAGYYPKGGPDVEAKDVSLIQLIANPQTYDHKIVRVIGYLRIEFEGNALYFHRDDLELGMTRNGVWIDLPKDMTPAQSKIVNNQYVICTARFVAGRHGHMGLFSGEFDEVTRLEAWPHMPRRDGAESEPRKR